MIPKEQSDQAQCRRPVLYASAARTAFGHLLGHLRVPTEAHVLLPSYVGYSPRESSGVLDPIVEAGVRYAFYRVDQNLAADLDDLRAQTAARRVFMVFLIHYFGFIQPGLAEIVRLCREQGLLLVEDCAHCLAAPTRIGQQGDYALFSIHKTHPTRDGGMLVANRGPLALPPLPAARRISPVSLETYVTSDHAEIARRRVTNYRALARLLQPLADEGRLTFYRPELDAGTVPLNLPILLWDRSRHDVYQSLLAQGVQTMALYYQLIDPITATDYPVSHRVSRAILNLPIHQDLDAGDLERIAAALRTALH